MLEIRSNVGLGEPPHPSPPATPVHLREHLHGFCASSDKRLCEPDERHQEKDEMHYVFIFPYALA